MSLRKARRRWPCGQSAIQAGGHEHAGACTGPRDAGRGKTAGQQVKASSFSVQDDVEQLSMSTLTFQDYTQAHAAPPP
jgi:hypothetical protein